MPPAGCEKLSPTQKRCLRLVYDRKSGGDIARALGISKSTVESHLAQARRVLGVTRSVAAAELLHAHERQGHERQGHEPPGHERQEHGPPEHKPPGHQPPEPGPPEHGPPGHGPQGDQGRGAPPCDPATYPAPLPAGPAAAPSAGSGGRPWWQAVVPLRIEGAPGNDLSIPQRLVGILAVAIGAAIGFGALADGLRTVSDLVVSLAHR